MHIELYEQRNQARKLPPNPDILLGNGGWSSNSKLHRDSPAAVIFVPSPPIGATRQALEAAKAVFSKRAEQGRVIAVTDLPHSVEHTLQEMQHGKNWSETLIFEGTNQNPPLDIALSEQQKIRHDPNDWQSYYYLADRVILMRKGKRNGTLVGETLRKRFGVKDLRIIPNTHIGFENISAEVAQYFGLNYPSPETVRQLGTKSEFRKLQRSLGLRAPEQSPVIITNTDGKDVSKIEKQFGDTPVLIAKDSRQAKATILSQIETIGGKTGKDKVVIKAVDGFGSVSVRVVDRRLTLEEREKLVEKHLNDRDKFGRDSTIVEEFMNGVEVGCHITTSGGKVDIKYTRKTMAKGAKGDQSEEVEHIIDPNDPLFDLCKQILTPQIMKVVEYKGLQYYNASHNGDAMLDQRYFDGDQVKKRPPEIKEDDDSHLGELNAARKGGTALEKLIAAATGEREYPQWEILANMGESESIDAMNAATYKNAAIIHTDLWDISGHAIDISGHHGIISYVTLNERGKYIHQAEQETPVYNCFYRGEHMFDTTYNVPGVFDTIKRLQPVGDYLTKGSRPVFGVGGSNIEEARHVLGFQKIYDNIIVLRGGTLYANNSDGGYKRLQIDPQDMTGTFLREQRGLEYRRGRWVLGA